MARTNRNRRRRRKVPEYQSYIFRIENWEPGYSLATNHDDRLFEGLYREHLDLAPTGTFLSPEKAKDRRARLTLHADRRAGRLLDDPTGTDWKPLSVGALTIRGDRTD